MHNICATKIHFPTICALNKYNSSANLSWVIFKLCSQFPNSGLSRLDFRHSWLIAVRYHPSCCLFTINRQFTLKHRYTRSSVHSTFVHLTVIYQTVVIQQSCTSSYIILSVHSAYGTLDSRYTRSQKLCITYILTNLS